MIVSEISGERFSLNLYRPNIVDELTRKYWTDFHDHIKSSPYPIVVNAVYPFIEHILKNPDGGYIGNGFKYVFWFESENDIKLFAKEMLQINKADLAQLGERFIGIE